MERRKDVELVEDRYVFVLCQQCGKNKVRIVKDNPYFGILCAACQQRTVYGE